MTTLRTMVEQSLAAHSDGIALVEGEREFSFDQFAKRTSCMGNALLDLGLARGDRVAILDRNSIETAESYFSVPNAGLILVMLNLRLAPPEILAILADAQVSALIVSREFFEKVTPVLGQLGFIKHFILIGDGPVPQNWCRYENLIAGGRSGTPDVHLEPSDLAALMYTSGTTGTPKGCMVTHYNFFHAGQTMSAEMAMDRDDRGIVTTPIFHASGMVVLMNGIYSGTPTVIMPRWDPHAFLALVEKHRITTGVLATPMLLSLIQVPDVGCPSTKSLKKLIFAGAPVTPVIFEKAIRRFGNVFIHGFGTTETVGSICILRQDDITEAMNQGDCRILSSCGKAYTDMIVEVVNDIDQPACDEHSGEIRVRGAGVSNGYWNKPFETEKAFTDGWFYTGDIARMDDEGFFYIIGRKKDVIITGAENVFPAELERILHTHPDVEEAAVIGLENAKWGEIVTAFVVTKKGADLDCHQVRDFCREQVAGYKVPKKIFFIDKLPISATGKLLKNKLKEQYSDRGVYALA